MKTTKWSKVLLALLTIGHMKSTRVNVMNISDMPGEGANISAEEPTVTVGLLLPRQGGMAQHSLLDSVLPGVVLAAQAQAQVLPGWSWDILVGDTGCNSTTGPLQAVHMFYNKR